MMLLDKNGKFKFIEVYFTAFAWNDFHLIARVRTYYNGMPSFGANLLRECYTTDVERAMYHVWEKLTSKTNRIKFEFEPLLNYSSIEWSDSSHELAKVIVDASLKGKQHQCLRNI